MKPVLDRSVCCCVVEDADSGEVAREVRCRNRDIVEVEETGLSDVRHREKLFGEMFLRCDVC